MRLFLVFILFVLVEYVLRTFMHVYKYHTVGLYMEFLPLVIIAFVSGLVHRKAIVNQQFGWTYLRLVVVSIAGLILVKTFLFVQWYWFIAPEYRNVPGDMSEGMGFEIAYLVISTIVILVSYIVVIAAIRFSERRLKRLDKQ